MHRPMNLLTQRLAWILGVLLCLTVFYVPSATANTTEYPDRYDVPYVPTPHDVVAKMLELADVGPSDFLIDLGSGDGRIAIAAVRDHGARKAYGVDLNPVRVQEARANAEEAGVADRVTFEVQNLFDTDFSQADVVSMYLLPSVNLKLRSKILDMAPGTRVVSHAFDMGDWYADTHVRVDNLDVYLWIVPEDLSGRWTVVGPDGEFEIDVDQEFQHIQGVVEVAGKQTGTLNGQLRGSVVQFDVDDGGSTRRYVGQVTADTITPMPEPGSQPDWRAHR